MANDDLAAIRARHAEIKRRHGRKVFADNKSERIKSVRRAQVLYLLRHRHDGNILPDDKDSRSSLQLLFELGLDGMAAQQLAPWASGGDIEQLIDDANSNGSAWSKPDKAADPTIAERIGQRLKIEFEEFKRLRLSHIRPADVSRDVVDKYIRDRKAKRDANRDRKIAKPVSADRCDLPNGRARAVAYAILRDREWWSIRLMTERALEIHVAAFAQLDYSATRRAMVRTVKYLEGLGIVETKKESGPRGLPVLYARRPMTPAELEAEQQELLDEVAAEQASEHT
jgi:hypothetical protein